MTNETETSIRFKVRQQYKEEGALYAHKEYPMDSAEYAIALDEVGKILDEEGISA